MARSIVTTALRGHGGPFPVTGSRRFEPPASGPGRPGPGRLAMAAGCTFPEERRRQDRSARTRDGTGRRRRESELKAAWDIRFNPTLGGAQLKYLIHVSYVDMLTHDSRESELKAASARVRWDGGAWQSVAPRTARARFPGLRDRRGSHFWAGRQVSSICSAASIKEEAADSAPSR